jgi:hypothetical protein
MSLAPSNVSIQRIVPPRDIKVINLTELPEQQDIGNQRTRQ